MKALPQAIAGASFHSGIMAGKLNGVMPATTPSGWRIEYMSMPGPAPSVNSPFMQMRDAGAELDHLDAALDVALGVGDGLAVLAGEQFGERVDSRWAMSSRNFIITRARRCGLVAAQAGCAALAFSTACAQFVAWRPARHVPMTSPVMGWKKSAVRPELPGNVLAADEMSDLAHGVFSS